MLTELKAQLKEAKEAVDKVIDKIEDEAEGFADESKTLWHKSKTQLSSLKDKLNESAQHLESNTEETLLQAHLAAMDAGDHWQALKQHISDFSSAAKHKTQPVFDHTAVQAHLAKMDARDFIASSSATVAEQYKASRERSLEAAAKSARDIKQQCENLLK